MRSQDYDRLYLSPPHLGRHELNYVHKAIEDNWVAPAGPNLAGFEADICAAVGVPYCVALASGTAAIHPATKCCAPRSPLWLRPTPSFTSGLRRYL